MWLSNCLVKIVACPFFAVNYSYMSWFIHSTISTFEDTSLPVCRFMKLHTPFFIVQTNYSDMKSSPRKTCVVATMKNEKKKKKNAKRMFSPRMHKTCLHHIPWNLISAFLPPPPHVFYFTSFGRFLYVWRTSVWLSLPQITSQRREKECLLGIFLWMQFLWEPSSFFLFFVRISDS